MEYRLVILLSESTAHALPVDITLLAADSYFRVSFGMLCAFCCLSCACLSSAESLGFSLGKQSATQQDM